MIDPGRQLGERLRALREAGLGGRPVTQRVVASAFHRSVPLISSWEKGKALPSTDWLHAYARFFASSRSYADGRPRLLTPEDLRDEEQDRYEELLRELESLRAAAGVTTPPAPASAADLWHFADGSAITLVCARQAAVPRTSGDRPDHVTLAAYRDLDALFELYGHLRAANPGAPVHHRLADDLTPDDVTNHLVLLGDLDRDPMGRRVTDALHLPVTREPGRFRVRGRGGHHTVHAARLTGDTLVEDVAQFCRAPNPFDRTRSVTICNGGYGRGTYAAVRTLTDPRFRDRNRAHLERRYGPGDTYSILARADVVAGEVITPDWTRDGTVLHEWRKP